MSELRRKMLLLVILIDFVLITLIGMTGIQLKNEMGSSHFKLAERNTSFSILFQPNKKTP